LQVCGRFEHGNKDAVYIAIGVRRLVQNIVDERLQTLKIGTGTFW